MSLYQFYQGDGVNIGLIRELQGGVLSVSIDFSNTNGLSSNTQLVYGHQGFGGFRQWPITVDELFLQFIQLRCVFGVR